MPPFKTVIHWPPSSALAFQSVDDSYLDDIRFMVRSGYAVVQPLFLGTYDRDNEESPINYISLWEGFETPKSTSYRDIVITWVQEYSRTIDFVETREDLSFEPLAFFGFSWGGDIAGIPLSIDDRVNFAVLVAGAIDNRYHYLPEADPFNYISRAMQPVLIINGEFDPAYPMDTSQIPVLEKYGAAAEDKKLVIERGSHRPSNKIVISETLAWFDKYFGDSEPD
jgi:pimeloyl-ACP methyl ester carboxylesterase